MVKSVDDVAVSAARAVGNPGAVAGLQDRLKRRNEPAGGNDGFNRIAFFLEDVHVGLAVGNKEERLFA